MGGRRAESVPRGEKKIFFLKRGKKIFFSAEKIFFSPKIFFFSPKKSRHRKFFSRVEGVMLSQIPEIPPAPRNFPKFPRARAGRPRAGGAPAPEKQWAGNPPSGTPPKTRKNGFCCP